MNKIKLYWLKKTNPAAYEEEMRVNYYMKHGHSNGWEEEAYPEKKYNIMYFLRIGISLIILGYLSFLLKNPLIIMYAKVGLFRQIIGCIIFIIFIYYFYSVIFYILDKKVLTSFLGLGVFLGVLFGGFCLFVFSIINDLICWSKILTMIKILFFPSEYIIPDSRMNIMLIISIIIGIILSPIMTMGEKL